MENINELLKKAFEAGREGHLVPTIGWVDTYEDFDDWLSKSSAQGEASSVEDNEANKEPCNCGIFPCVYDQFLNKESYYCVRRSKRRISRQA